MNVSRQIPISRQRDHNNLPFGTAEPEAVGEFASESLPVSILLLLRELEERIVEALELLVLLGNDSIVSPATSILATTTTTASATAAAFSVLAL